MAKNKNVNVNAENVNTQEEVAMLTTENQTEEIVAPQTEENDTVEEEVTPDPVAEAAQNDLPPTENNAPEDYTEDQIPEEIRPVVWPMILQKRAFQAQIGDKSDRLEAAKADLSQMEENVKVKREEIKALTEEIAVPQIRINQMDTAIKSLLAPVTLKAKIGAVKSTSKASGGEGEPSDRALKSALEVLAAISAEGGDPNDFDAKDLMAAKGCGRDTAGGILHRWETKGIIERKSVGRYGIAPSYAGMI